MKKKLLTALQILVTLGILSWVFHDPKTRAEMAAAITAANPWWVLSSVTAFGTVILLAMLRWQILLRVQGICIHWWRTGALVMIGMFFNILVPGNTGGDVFKIFYLLKEVPHKKAQALLTVLIDRILGLLGLMLIAVFIVWQRYDWLQQTEITRTLTWTLMLILLGAFGVIAFGFLVSSLGWADKLPAKMPLRDKIIDMTVAYNAYAKAWRASLISILISFGIHFSVFYMFYSAARSLGARVPIGDFFSLMPIVSVITSLPISVGGTGAREWLFQTLLGKLCAVPESQAFAISLLGFVVTVFWAAVGGAIYLFYRSSDHERMSEVCHEIEEIEHKIAEEK